MSRRGSGTGCTVRITRHGDPRALPEPVESLILDTLIEGLRNGVKHTAANLSVAHLGYHQVASR